MQNIAMNDTNSIKPYEWTGSPSAPELVSVRHFRAEMGVVPSTSWRWQQKGWLPPPINIGGRKYYRQDQLAEFRRRAAAGEFAADIKPPVAARRKQR